MEGNDWNKDALTDFPTHDHCLDTLIGKSHQMGKGEAQVRMANSKS
jgi:hypothetical protein